jgi:hypothetical protein
MCEIGLSNRSMLSISKAKEQRNVRLFNEISEKSLFSLFQAYKNINYSAKERGDVIQVLYCLLREYWQSPILHIVLLPENLRAYFELSAQAWILYKAPQHAPTLTLKQLNFLMQFSPQPGRFRN